jgi:hypothetical protein
MTTATAGARSEQLTPEEKASLRYAMLSVYYRSLGRQLESRGAPVIAVPPEVRPLSLDEALERLAQWPARLWDAYWRIVRAVPVEGWGRRGLERRYPTALVERLGGNKVEKLDNLRRHARANAHFLAAALVACAEGRSEDAKVLAGLLENKTGDMLEDDAGGVVEALAESTKSVLGQTAPEFVRWLGSSKEQLERTRIELCNLQADVGLNLNDFVEDFLDTVAFERFKEECEVPREARRTVLTSSCIVRQDTNTLTTTATVTALVPIKFDVLTKVIDPLGWPKCSDVIEETRYLDDPFDLSPAEVEQGPDGQGFKGPRFLFEDVRVNWGFDDLRTGRFRNVLTVDEFSVNEDLHSITLPFRLCRSIDSRILWDERAGGILIDGGYIKARPVGENRFRVTTRKVLKFSDRTPYSNAAGWLDFGQMLNYLAPAAVTWWLETELYSAECMQYVEDGPRVPGPAQHIEGIS